MKTLDLHGTKHYEVDRLVENFVLMNDLPVRIITGNSIAMKTLVDSVLIAHDLVGEFENYYNLGALVIKEKLKSCYDRNSCGNDCLW